MVDPKQLKFILEGLRFTAELPAAVLNELSEASTVQQLRTGAIVFREGSRNDNLYLVRHGRLALEMNVPGRGPVRILTVGPGDMFGWSALLGNGKMTASAVAVEDAQVVVSPADQLRQTCESNPEFGYYLMRQMADALTKRLVATRLQLLDLFTDARALTSDNNCQGQA